MATYTGRRDARFVTVRRGGILKNAQHRQLASWAADCAERVLPLFERERLGDDRPRRVIEQARAWVRGEITMTAAREAAYAAHNAAREAFGAAWEAVRAAGHAVATAHMADHELVAAAYALKAVLAAAGASGSEVVRRERDWQRAITSLTRLSLYVEISLNMFYLETTRLILVQTPLVVLETRLRQPTFASDVILPHGLMRVNFPAEWPGDALALFPTMIEQYQQSPDDIPWGGTLIDRAEQAAVGQMGCKGLPEHGSVEIGYGINPSYQNRGYATEMVQRLSAWALTQPAVQRVTAECRTDNYGSIRVLEKSGFVRTGQRMDEEDGLLLTWERTA